MLLRNIYRRTVNFLCSPNRRPRSGGQRELKSLGDSCNNKTSPKKKWRCLDVFTCFGVFFMALIMFCSIVKQHKGSDLARCQAVYMYPSYALINGLDTSYSKFAKKYHLYLYREQGKDVYPEINGEIKLDGIPVLFIPGNAGSYKQVRSIAAASAQLYMEESQFQNPGSISKNLDFFAADFNEDFTAFHGRTMVEQAEYCNDVIRYILSLYQKSKRYEEMGDPLPTSVLVLGHSMGGVVARLMTTLKNHIPESINTIITLSSPHAVSPVTSDGDTLKLYEQLNNIWRKKFEEDPFYGQNVSVFSIVGGILDTVVPADYTSTKGIVPYSNGFTSYTTTIPEVWTPVDHLAILWCGQLRRVIARLLLNIVDRTQPSKTRSLSTRMRISEKYLLSGLSTAIEPPVNTTKLHLGAGYDVIPSNELLTINRESSSTVNEYSVFNIPANEFLELTILVTQTTQVFACNRTLVHDESKGVEIFSDYLCVKVHQYFAKVPSHSFAASTINDEAQGKTYDYLLRLREDVLSRYEAIIIENSLPEGYNDDDFLVGQLTTTSTEHTHNITPLALLFKGFHEHFSLPAPLFTVKFPNLRSSLVAYTMHAKYSSGDVLVAPYMYQSISEPFETKWHFNLGGPIDISFNNEAPFVPFQARHDSSFAFSFIAPQQKELAFTLKINWMMTFKMLFLRYRLAIAALPTGIISLAMAKQFCFYYQTERLISFQDSLGLLMNEHYKILLFTSSVLSPILNFGVVQHLLYVMDPVGLGNPRMLKNIGLQAHFYYLGIHERLMFWLGPLFLIISVAMVHLIHALISALEFVLLKMTQFVLRLKSGSTVNYNELYEIKKRPYKKRIVIGAIFFLGTILLYVPYQCIVALITILQLYNCLKMGAFPGSSKEYENLKNYNNTILLLFLFVLPINLPIIVVFFHNLAIRWETPVTSHRNVLGILPMLLLLCNNVSGKMPNVVPSKKFHGKVLILILLYTAFYCAIYGIRNLFWIHYLIQLISGWLFFTTLDS